MSADTYDMLDAMLFSNATLALLAFAMPAVCIVALTIELAQRVGQRERETAA